MRDILGEYFSGDELLHQPSLQSGSYHCGGIQIYHFVFILYTLFWKPDLRFSKLTTAFMFFILHNG